MAYSLDQINRNLASIGAAAQGQTNAGASGYWQAAGQKTAADNQLALQRMQQRFTGRQNEMNRAMQERLAQVQLQGQIRPVEITTQGAMSRQTQKQDFAMGLLNQLFGGNLNLGNFLGGLGLGNLGGLVGQFAPTGGGAVQQSFAPQQTTFGSPQAALQSVRDIGSVPGMGPSMFTRINPDGSTFQQANPKFASQGQNPLAQALQSAMGGRR